MVEVTFSACEIDTISCCYGTELTNCTFDQTWRRILSCSDDSAITAKLKHSPIMATHYSANQYEKAFSANRLQNYQVPSKYKEHPSPRTGCTTIISNDRGHLLPGVSRSKESPWGNFKGTWAEDMQDMQDCKNRKHKKNTNVSTKQNIFSSTSENQDNEQRSSPADLVESCKSPEKEKQSVRIETPVVEEKHVEESVE